MTEAGADASLLLRDLPIDLEALPEEVDVLDRRWKRKDELHVTVVNGPAAIDQAAHTLGPDEAERRVRAAVERLAGDAQVRLRRFGGELRLARHAGDETLVAMCDVDGIESLMDRVSSTIGAAIEVPPTHVTLYTRGESIGIGTRAQLEELTKPLPAAAVGELRRLLGAALR